MLLAVGWIWSLYCDYNVLDGESSWRHVVLTCGKKYQVRGTFSKLAVGFSLTIYGIVEKACFFKSSFLLLLLIF